jgi:exodeoxyribonuclease VII small subunit
MAPKTKKAPREEPNYETAYDELQEIVSKLESGEVSLEGALALYERGQALVKICAGLLDEAELRIRELGTPPDSIQQDG